MTDRDQWAALVQARTAKPHKYGAKAKVVDGIRFASSKEAKRYQELKLLEKAKYIHNLTLQQKWALLALVRTPALGQWGKLIGYYVADFVYCECDYRDQICDWSKCTVEDVKGFKTPLYRWKKKHVEAQYGITITEI